MNRSIFNISPDRQVIIILLSGVCLTAVILYGLTNHFARVDIPAAYNVLIGK